MSRRESLHMRLSELDRPEQQRGVVWVKESGRGLKPRMLSPPGRRPQAQYRGYRPARRKQKHLVHHASEFFQKLLG